MEQLDLTVPEITPQIVTTGYIVISLSLNWQSKKIVIHLLGTNGEIKYFDYNGNEASQLMVALNKANLSIQSLHSRILSRLVVDGKISGNITGTPD